MDYKSATKDQVLVTNAIEFTGLWIIEYLVEFGYSVIGIVSNEKEGEWLSIRYPGHFQYCIIEKTAIVQTLNKLYQHIFQAYPGIKHVIHSTTDGSFEKDDDCFQKLFDMKRNSSISLLSAIRTHGKFVKSVVFTFSMATMVQSPCYGLDVLDQQYTESIWNPISVADVKKNPALKLIAEEAFNERAVYDFHDDIHPNFSIFTLILPLVFGPLLKQEEELNPSIENIYKMIKLPRFQYEIDKTPILFIDVRDVAYAILKTFSIPSLKSEYHRLFLVAGIADSQYMLNCIRRIKPEYDMVIPIGNPTGSRFSLYASYKNLETQRLLKPTYNSLEITLMDTIKSLESWEKRKKSKDSKISRCFRFAFSRSIAA